MNRLLVPLILACCLLQLSCSQNKKGSSQSGIINSSISVSEEKNYKRINHYLDNFTIRRASEDLETFRNDKKRVYSIRWYKSAARENNPELLKKIGGKDFYLHSYTEYLKDGRKRYKEYIYDHIQRIENYHYDEQTGNLLLLHRVEPNPENEKNDYQILNYYPDKLLKAEIGYRTYKGTDFDLMNYTSYGVKKHTGKINIYINHIGYDSIPAPQEVYIFTDELLTKHKPSYQSKKQSFKWIDSSYKPIKTEGYIFDDRNVDFTYDSKGFITSETWTKDGMLENKKDYEYNADYTEHIEQLYDQQGKQKSTKYIRKYNSQGDLIFDQTVEYNGNQLGPVIFEYVYDENDNWTERKKFKLGIDDDNSKTLLQHDVREIRYFDADSKIRELRFPTLSTKVAQVAKELPRAAGKKQRSIEKFNKAVDRGKYDSQITKTEAREIKDFTPKLWKLKVTAFGDLDNLPGEEAVAVYETPVPIDPGFEQVLAVFKKQGDKWMLWHQSASPLLGTQGGGTMGNPFDGVSIANRTIIINHFGGSRQKWRYKHIYRYQNNDWYLIGASVNFGAPCDYFINFDYNLSTGDVIAGYHQEICNDEDKQSDAGKQWKKRFKWEAESPKMDDFTPGANKCVVPGLAYEIYY